MKDSFKLTQRTCLIAGGSGRIGYPIARTCATLGARVIICDQEAETCEKLAAELPRPSQSEHIGIGIDLTDESQLSAFGDRFQNGLEFDALIHCVGLTSHSRLDGYAVPLNQQSVDAWRVALEVNLTTAFALCQQLEPALRKSPHASVTLLSSIYSELGPNNSFYDGTDMANPVAYGASKGGLLQLMRYLATQWAPEIRVNAVSPGGVEDGQPASFIDKYTQATPLKRMATPDDIAWPVAFLASDAARYITGHNLIVDGGLSAW